MLENFVEPKVMGRTLDIHPLIVLVVTALGGVIGGIVGLILAVPFFAIARNAIARLRSRGVVKQVADRVWMVSFMDYDLGFFDDETGRIECADNPFGAKVLPMSPV